MPTARPLGEPVPSTEVHHFLLPAAGWGAVADAAEATEGRPKATQALKAWRKSVTAMLSTTEKARLQFLGQRVETLWALAQRRLEVAEKEIRRRVDVWGAGNLATGSEAVQREQIEASLTDINSAYLRLRRVMDAWAALWFWPVTTSITPPTREQWIKALESLLGTVSRAEARKGRGLFADEASWAELDEAEQNEIAFARMRPVSQVLDEGDERYLDERASLAGMSAHLGSSIDRPLLAGTQPDLYRCFMDRTWRSMGPGGVVGLIHPESHFTEARAGGLRRQTYRRLRRHWQFSNNMYLFSEISDKTHFGVSVYGQPREPSFLNASSLFHPSVADRSLDHDGTGPEPGIRDDDDRWDTRPHAGRIVRVDESVLAGWAALIDEQGTPPVEARMLRPVNTASQEVLDKLAAAPRFGALSFEWTRGWEEDADRRAGFFVGRSAVPDSLDDVILQGPHLTVANPFARQPNENARNRQDTVAWDLETLGERPIPRTNYQPAKTASEYLAGYPRWNGTPANQFWRLAWRAMADTSTVRTVHAALLPPGPMHILGLFSATTESLRDLAIAAGMWASVLTDFFAKVAGKTNLKVEDISRFPHPGDHALVDHARQCYAAAERVETVQTVRALAVLRTQSSDSGQGRQP